MSLINESDIRAKLEKAKDERDGIVKSAKLLSESISKSNKELLELTKQSIAKNAEVATLESLLQEETTTEA